MKLENSIGWCDDTTNAVTGCAKVSEGCKNCYAESGTRARVLRHRGIETWGPKGVRYQVQEFQAKLRGLNKLCVCDKCHLAHPISSLNEFTLSCIHPCNGTLRRIRLFADSNSDWLDDQWPIETLANFLNEIRLAPNVDVLLLTKRTENWRSRLNDILESDGWYEDGCNMEAFADWIMHWRDLVLTPTNIWLGVSVENQQRAAARIPLLLAIPAAVRFLSCEPLLEAVDLMPWLGDHEDRPANWGEIDWVIVGGESGAGRRDCGVEPIVDIAAQCQNSGVPVYVKQDCAFKSGQQGRIPDAIWALKQFPDVRTPNS
jgi:protein gp37